MERAVTLVHRKARREFILSARSKPSALRSLVRRAFNLQSEIRWLRSSNGSERVTLEQLVAQGRQGEFELVLEEDSSEDKSRSEVCSQKNMSKVSGRKNPPSEQELLDSKFYIDDFQLFMSEVSGRKADRFFGIVFFNSKRKASFLGKKILRELIFEFDRIEFFYALHPIKMHTSSALLGDVLVFSLFRGKRMLQERQFPEQITAADEIPHYIKNLIKIGQVNFDAPPPEQKKSKNLIHVHLQRSFDHQLQNSPQKLSDFGGKPNRTAELIKIKPITPDKDTKVRKAFHPRAESPMRSQITNEISFESEFYQPEWFFQGDALRRLEKGILSALIKVNDQALITFLSGLGLKDTAKEKLNVKLVKVFLREAIEERLANFTQAQREFIEQNQENRKSFVFAALLKLYKFGDIKDFVEVVAKGLGNLPANPAPPSAPQEQTPKKETVVIQYSSIAKQHDKNKPGFTIKLLDCANDTDAASPRQHPSPFRQNPKRHLQHVQVARLFHSQPLQRIEKNIFKEVQLGGEYEEAERAAICDLIIKSDAFMIQAFVKPKGKKPQRMPARTVKKYLRQIESRYQSIRERTVVSDDLSLKLQKLQIFNGLLYYLYKQRIINKKQLKISFYLYTWSDLNVLSAFQLYLTDRNIDQFVDTLYAIDYNYCLLGLYEIDHAEVEQFTLDIESQLIILFLFEGAIHSGEARISLQKFIRAGDNSLLKLYADLKMEQDELVRRMVQLGHAKKEELASLNRNELMAEVEARERKKERCSFLDQIALTRLKGLHKKELIKHCINSDEPDITALFDKLDETNDQMQFLDALKAYSQKIDETHMGCVMRQLAEEAGIDSQRLQECRADILKGIYETYMVTKDKSDTIDTLQRAIKKTKLSSPNSPSSPTSGKQAP